MYVIYLDACHGFSFFCNNFNILCIFCVFVFWRATFPSLTRGNSIVCMFFGFVCVFCVCVRVLCVYVLVCTSLASYISIALREVTPLCVVFWFCLCSCFMCLCFGVHQLGELHFHRITRGNQVTTGIHRPLSPSTILSKPATPHF